MRFEWVIGTMPWWRLYTHHGTENLQLLHLYSHSHAFSSKRIFCTRMTLLFHAKIANRLYVRWVRAISYFSTGISFSSTLLWLSMCVYFCVCVSVWARLFYRWVFHLDWWYFSFWFFGVDSSRVCFHIFHMSLFVLFIHSCISLCHLIYFIQFSFMCMHRIASHRIISWCTVWWKR